MHLDSAMISSSTLGNSYYHHTTFLGADSALSPDHMASCSPSLISPYPAAGLSSTMVNSPVSPPVMSPTSNSFISNDIMDTKVFQFPPPSHLQGSSSNMSNVLSTIPHHLPDDSNTTLSAIKQEEWNLPCLQDSLTQHNQNSINMDPSGRVMHHISTPAHHQSSDDGLQNLCFPSVASTSNTLQQPDQGSPMAISPASLNTPRGSITSFRSRSQQNSPMNMDSVLTTFTSLAPTSCSAQTNVSSSCITSCSTTAVLSSSAQMEMLNDINASFTIQVPTTSTINGPNTQQSYSTSQINSMQNTQTMLSEFQNNDSFNQEGDNNQQYISYTMLQPSLMAAPQPPSSISDRFPSPPRSPCSQDMPYSQNYQGHVVTSQHQQHTNPPPTYEEFMNSGMIMPMSNETHLGQHLASNNPSDVVLSSNEIHNFFNEGTLKTEPDIDAHFMTSLAGGMQDSMKCKPGMVASSVASSIPDHDSLFTSDTCPETPDSSVKEDTDVNSPDTGNYVCLWQDCNEEFDNPKTYVDHVNEAHMETRKGCEEFPCLWKVSENIFIPNCNYTTLYSKSSKNIKYYKC